MARKIENAFEHALRKKMNLAHELFQYSSAESTYSSEREIVDTKTIREILGELEQARMHSYISKNPWDGNKVFLKHKKLPFAPRAEKNLIIGVIDTAIILGVLNLLLAVLNEVLPLDKSIVTILVISANVIPIMRLFLAFAPNQLTAWKVEVGPKNFVDSYGSNRHTKVGPLPTEIWYRCLLEISIIYKELIEFSKTLSTVDKVAVLGAAKTCEDAYYEMIAKTKKFRCLLHAQKTPEIIRVIEVEYAELHKTMLKCEELRDSTFSLAALRLSNGEVPLAKCEAELNSIIDAQKSTIEGLKKINDLFGGRQLTAGTSKE
jgi:hypothetical protein